MFESDNVESLKIWLKKIQNDKITKILIHNSNLTEIQFETFLIDLFFRNNDFKMIKKHQLRSNNYNISRGSFNHTRKQALNNIIKSIYTVLLLGYFGILETPQLEPFIEGGNRLNSYIKSMREIIDKEDQFNFSMFENILKEELDELTLRKIYYK